MCSTSTLILGYIYIYTLWFQFAKFANQIFRKPDVCPVSEAKFRKPVLAGLRSNNEMNSFGFRRWARRRSRQSWAAGRHFPHGVGQRRP